MLLLLLDVDGILLLLLLLLLILLLLLLLLVLELVDSISAFQEIFEMVFDVGLFLFFYRKAEGEDFGGH